MIQAEWKDLLGKKVVAFRGHLAGKRKTAELQFILFDDKETILQLDEQDPYTYHDCSSAARELSVIRDKDWWQRLWDKEGYDEPRDLGVFAL